MQKKERVTLLRTYCDHCGDLCEGGHVNFVNAPQGELHACNSTDALGNWVCRNAIRDLIILREKLMRDPVAMENLRHMLGADSRFSQRQWGFRNHFCAGAGSTDFAIMEQLEKANFVQRGSKQGSGNVFFHATRRGCQALGFKPAQIKRAMEG